MSCDSRRRRAWKALASADRVTDRIDPAAAEQLLREAYAHGRATGCTAGEDDIDSRAAALMDRMRWLTGEVPAHGENDPRFGVPLPASRQARAGYAAALDVLDQIEGRRPPADPAVRQALGQHRYPLADVRPLDAELGPEVNRLIERLRARGMRANVVGGWVRDRVLGKSAKDVDLEVYGGGERELVDVLRQTGPFEEVGKSFGVFKVTVPGETEPVDVSMPRRDSKAGTGHRGIEVKVDPGMSPADAAKRRDLTFNAMSYDPELGVVVDFYGGQDDLAAGRIRHVDDSFRDDPLRALRAARFAAVYNGTLDPDTARMCRELRDEYATLPEERLQGEWDKLVRGSSPDAGLRALRGMGWDQETPGLRDVGSRADDVARAAARVADEHALSGDARAQHVYSAIISTMPDGGQGFLSAIGESRMRSSLARKASNVVKEQDAHAGDPDDAAVRALARRLAPATTRDWARHQQSLGRDSWRAWHDRAQAIGVADAPELRILEGRDVIPLARSTVRPGPWTGRLIQDAALAQERGEFRDKAGGLEWARKQMRDNGLAP